MTCSFCGGQHDVDHCPDVAQNVGQQVELAREHVAADDAIPLVCVLCQSAETCGPCEHLRLAVTR